MFQYLIEGNGYQPIVIIILIFLKIGLQFKMDICICISLPYVLLQIIYYHVLYVYICMYNIQNGNEKSYAINCWLTEDPL